MSHDDIKAALEAATPGPWESTPLGSEGYTVTGAPDPGATGVRAKVRLRIARFGYQDWDTDRANAHLIANAPTWLAELLADVDRLKMVAGGSDAIEEFWEAAGLPDCPNECGNCRLCAVRSAIGWSIAVAGNPSLVAAAAKRPSRFTEPYVIEPAEQVLAERDAAIARAEAAEQTIQRVRELAQHYDGRAYTDATGAILHALDGGEQ